AADVVHHDIGAARRQQQRMGAAEAGISAGSRDDGRPAVETQFFHGSPPQRVVRAPSTAMAWPFTKLAPSPQSHTAIAPISSGSPKRPAGVVPIMPALISAMVPSCVIGVRIMPGQMAFTRKPCCPYSRAAVLVRPTTPCLAAE